MAGRTNTEKAAIFDEARKRFKRAMTWESTARSRFVEDVKFCEGDSDNLYQWPSEIRNARSDEERPMLTINKTRQHVLDVLNDARQSRVAIKFRPVGDGADVKSSNIFNGIARHVEYISNAQEAYQHGLKFAVQGGKGWWRVVTDYEADDSFDQEIYIRRVQDALSVYIDPDIKEFDGSDAGWGFVSTDLAKDAFDEKYPAWKDKAANADLGDESWVKEDSVRIAEYFRRVPAPDTLYAFPDLKADPTGQTMKMELESKLDPATVKELKRTPNVRRRAVKKHRVEWFLIIGDQIAEEREWLGIYIPLVRCVGEETIIDGQYDCKGHVRALKDPQRMFNYNASAAVEYGALQSKSPYVGPIEAFEGLEAYWDTANRENWPWLPYNSRDDDGNVIPPPSRQPPPTGAPVFMQGMLDSAEHMRMVSGQYQADMGAPSNERSGVAIQQRQRQGDNATYHYLDHQAKAIRFTGKILLDLIPKIYDTKRVRKIISEEGTENEVTVDPHAPQALQEQKTGLDEVETIFNPNVGKYDVVADVGPSYATRRQEAFEAYSQILAQNKELTAVIGDLALRFADFPGAEEAAERLKRMVPRQALEDGPAPDLLAAQQQIQALEELLKKLAMQLADKTAKHITDVEKTAVSGYEAQTRRLAALKDALAVDPDGLLRLVKEVLSEAELTSAAAIEPTVRPAAPAAAPPAAGPAPGGGLPQVALPAGGGGAPPAPDAGAPPAEAMPPDASAAAAAPTPGEPPPPK
jgi:hypothetical protein